MNIKRMIFFRVSVLLAVCLALFPAQTRAEGETAAQIKKVTLKEHEKIRKLYNKTGESYRELKDKIAADKTRTRAEYIKNKMQYCYDQAKAFEKAGEYRKARKYYVKLLGITEDRVIKSFIFKKNRELKDKAYKKKMAALSKIRNEEAKIRELKRLNEKEKRKAKRERRARKSVSRKKDTVPTVSYSEKDIAAYPGMTRPRTIMSSIDKRAPSRRRHPRRRAKVTKVKEESVEEWAVSEEIVDLDVITSDEIDILLGTAKIDREPAMQIKDDIEIEEELRIAEELSMAALKAEMQEMRDKEIAQRENNVKEFIYDAKYFIEEGDRLFKKADYKKAFETYRKAITAVEKADKTEFSTDSTL